MLQDATQREAIKVWRYETARGEASPALRSTIARHARYDAKKEEGSNLPLFDQAAREHPSILDVIDALENGSPYDSIELDAIAAAYEAYPQAVGVLFEAVRYRVMGFPLPDALKQRLRRERQRSGLALSLTAL
ncbi:MAG: hypothetical protein QM753_16055 [Thermomicrobiales bacterium]